jgi:hypothetical protein
MAQHRKTNATARSEGGLPRKPYQAPQLYLYGDIADVTRTLPVMTGNNDNGKGQGSDKTGSV